MGDLTDVADINDSLLARVLATWDTVHIHVAIIVADKDSPPAVVSLIKARLEKKYEVDLLDDDDIDAGSADLEIYDLIFVAGDVTDMTKINELTTLGVPIATGNPEVALTILRMGDDSGGSGTSWGTATAQTQVNIVDNTHQITLTKSLGNTTVYETAGNITWLRASDLVTDAEELAEIAGDNTKSALVVLPYDAPDEDGNPAPMPRVFWGIVEGAKWNGVTESMFYAMLDWLLYQGRRLVEVQGLGKINTIRNMLGTNFVTARNVYDYLVTGTSGSVPFAVITEQEEKSVMERLQWLKNSLRRGSGTILPTNKSLYDLVALDRLDNATYGLSALKTKIDRKVSPMSFLSVIDNVIDLPATAADTDLPNVVISGIPSGATLTKVLVFVIIRAIENTSATGANAIQGAQNIRIKKSTGAWGTDDIIAIPLTDNMWTVAASTREFGDVIGGDDAHDVKSEVDGNATYNLRFEDADVDYNYLRLSDVQCMIKVWFT